MDPILWLSRRHFLVRSGRTILGLLVCFLLVSPNPGEAQDSAGVSARADEGTVETSDQEEPSGGDQDLAGNRSLSTSPYVRVGSFGGYRRIADEIFGDDDLDTPTTSLFGVGAVLNRGGRFSLDLGVFLSSAELELATSVKGPGPEEPTRSVLLQTDPDLLGVRTALRYQLLPTACVSPWISVGGRGMFLESDAVQNILFSQPEDVGQTEESELFDLTVGAGLDWNLSPRVAVSLDGEYGLHGTGWTGGLSVAFRPDVPAPCDPVPLRLRHPDLDVDTNRNGQVEEQIDDPGEAEFRGVEGGAIILANLDDDDGDGGIDSANRVRERGADDSDLAPLEIHLTGEGFFFSLSQYYLRVRRDLADHWVRIFDGTTPILDQDSGEVRDLFKVWQVPRDRLRSGLQLSVEARSFATRPSQDPCTRPSPDPCSAPDDPDSICQRPWDCTRHFDGTIDLDLIGEGFFGSEFLVDSIELRVAPWMMPDPLAPTKEVFIVQVPGSSAQQERSFLGKLFDKRDLAELIELPHRSVWGFVQDIQELGFSAAHNGQVLDAALGTPYSWPFGCLLVPAREIATVAACNPKCRAVGGDCNAKPMSMDSMGNLSVTPPLPLGNSDEKEWPFGRIYYGGVEGDDTSRMVQELRDFLAAQEVQGPVELDTSWLYVGHVDEIISFIPNPRPESDEKPFKVLLASPEKALELLLDSDTPSLCDRSGFTRNMTDRDKWMDLNADAQKKLREVRDELEDHFNLNPQDFIEVPVYFEGREATSMLPNMVNLLIVSGHLVIPDPCHQAFRTTLEQELKTIGYEPGAGYGGFTFIDTIEWYHMKHGEIHCGTNPRQEHVWVPWWQWYD